MQILHLEVENWKCWAKKKTWDFSMRELCMQPNGTGKTSMFEAIHYAVTGKMPTGFTMNSIRNDPDSSAYVLLTAKLGEQDVEVVRTFGGKGPVKVTLDGKVVAESVREVDAWMGKLLPLNVVSMLWTDTLKENDVLNASYLAESVLDEALVDANRTIAGLTTERYALNKELGTLHPEEPEDLEWLQSQLRSVQDEIAELAKAPQEPVERARKAKIAHAFLQHNKHLKEASEAYMSLTVEQKGRLSHIVEQYGDDVELQLQAEIAKAKSRLEGPLKETQDAFMFLNGLGAEAFAQARMNHEKAQKVLQLLETCDLNGLKKQLSDLQKDEMLDLAYRAEKAAKELSTINVVELSVLMSQTGMSVEQWLECNKNRKRLQEELDEALDGVSQEFQNVDVQSLERTIRESGEKGVCLVCGEAFDQKTAESRLEAIQASAQLAKKADALKRQLAALKMVKKKDAMLLKKAQELECVVNKCPNYQETILSVEKRIAETQQDAELLQSVSDEEARYVLKIVHFDELVRNNPQFLHEVDHWNERLALLQSDLQLVSVLRGGGLKDVQMYVNSVQDLSLSENWEDVLRTHEEHLQELLQKMEEWKERIEKGKQNALLLQRTKKIHQELEELQQMLLSVKEWVATAKEKWTESIMQQSSKTLQQINSRYKGIYMSGKDFLVVVEDQESVLNVLPVSRLSSGERTIVALSLLSAVHDIFTPDLPYLFDETFPALDGENLAEVQKYLLRCPCQVFVITHDPSWEVFA